MGSSDIDGSVERELRRELRARDDAPDYPDDVDEPRDYGDRGECEVCGARLDKPPQPEGPQFCEQHDWDDLHAMQRRDSIAEHALEHLAGSQQENWDA